MEFEPYIVYVKLNENYEITAVNSNAFLKDTHGWTELARGYGDQFHHAQGNYFDMPLMDDNGVYRYWVSWEDYEEDGYGVEIHRRTDEEMAALYEPPAHQPSDKERIAALEEELKATKILLGVSE